MNFFVSGDMHGDINKIVYFKNQCISNNYDINNVAYIILGDAGINYYGNEKDENAKSTIEKIGIRLYCVRGNHEMRPENVKEMKEVYDEDVKGNIYVEEKYPNIRYLVDGGEYEIDGHSVLVIGGAYSVDKFYRLMMGYRWFNNEQLDENEKIEIENSVKGKHFDFVFTHTCPYEWEPRDLFLSSIDQSQVDDSTERWLSMLERQISYKIWLFGHFHDDRIIRNGVEMLMHNNKSIQSLWEHWNNE